MDATESPDPRTAVTDCLHDWHLGDVDARDRLFQLVYDQLHRIAHNALRGERDDITLATTDLVHEAYIKLVDQTRVEWRDRGHFLAVASSAMRRVLLDHARRRAAAKRGGAPRRVPLLEDALSLDERAETLIALDDAVTRLANVSPRLASVIECRFYGGLSEEATAEALGITARTVRRDWVKARGWLHRELDASDPSGASALT